MERPSFHQIIQQKFDCIILAILAGAHQPHPQGAAKGVQAVGAGAARADCRQQQGALPSHTQSALFLLHAKAKVPGWALRCYCNMSVEIQPKSALSSMRVYSKRVL